MKLAILSPSYNSFSESFIQAHKRLTENACFYYGGLVPQFLERRGSIVGDSKFIRSLKIRILFHIFRRPRILFYPRYFSLNERILAESLYSNKITHVLAEFGNCAASVMRVCDYLRINLIAHFHGYEISRYDVLNQFSDKYRELFKIASNVIVVSHLMERRVIQLGCDCKKIAYIPCGPDDAMSVCNPAFNNDNILFIGRFVEKKAPMDVILAFSKVLYQVPSARLTMIGDGPLFEKCRMLADGLGILEKVIFCGPVNHDDICRSFENSAVYLQPSATAPDGDQEGTPVSVMEACYAGIPVVSTVHAGIPDVIADGVTGFLVAEHDTEAMSKRIIQLLLNKNQARIMGEKGRETIRQNYSLTISLEKIRSMLVK